MFSAEFSKKVTVQLWIKLFNKDLPRVEVKEMKKPEVVNLLFAWVSYFLD